jgi:pimeloyl-ACP methyl ester carboxylesterase
LLAAGVDDHVVIAGHSQGSVIAAALMLMHRPEQVKARMSLLTYGCPLGRLYMRAFPGYLGPQVLGVGQGSEPGAHQPALTVRSRSWRWLNLYRETDPIGGYVDQPAGSATNEDAPMFGPSGATRTGDIDVVLVDPDFAVPPGDIFPPSVAGHSHYREDPTYQAAVAELL